jgi:hypothetical protein
MPFPCHAVLSHLIYTVRPCLIHTYHADPLPYHKYAFHGRFLAGSRQGDGMRTAWERHVGDLPAIGVFLLPRGDPERLFSEAYQSQMQVASVKQNKVCHGRGEAYYFGART